VALVRKMTRNLRHPMGLRHPIPASGEGGRLLLVSLMCLPRYSRVYVHIHICVRFMYEGRSWLLLATRLYLLYGIHVWMSTCMYVGSMYQENWLWLMIRTCILWYKRMITHLHDSFVRWYISTCTRIYVSLCICIYVYSFIDWYIY